MTVCGIDHYNIRASDDEELATDIQTTLNHIALACTGRADVEERLQKFGVSYRTVHVPATKVVQLFIKDSAGNGIELSFGDEG